VRINSQSKAFYFAEYCRSNKIINTSQIRQVTQRFRTSVNGVRLTSDEDNRNVEMHKSGILYINVATIKQNW